MRAYHLFSIGCFAVLLACFGCSNPIVTPDTARLGPSQREDFPYKLRIELVQKIRFNVHTLSPAHTDVPMECFVLLRRDSGTLTTGDFYVGSLGGTSPMPTRGIVTFRGDRVRIEAELARGADPAKGWEASLANGDYLVIRK